MLWRVSSRKRVLAAGFAALISGSLLVSARITSAQGTKNPKTIAHTLRFADAQNIRSLNPHLYTGTPLALLSQLTMAYLARYDKDNRPIPELATVIPTQANGGISRDGKTITWHVRKDAKWSDGVPFDGDDVVFSTKAVLNPKNNEVGRDGWELIEKIDQPDKYTVVYHMKKPFASYLPIFFGSAGANPCILPKHILGDLPDINEAPYNSKPIGIGPFRYVSWKRGDAVELEANPNYFRGRPKLQRVIFKVVNDANTLTAQMKTGELDLWTLVNPGFYDRMKGIANVDLIKNPGFYYAHLDFNVTRPRVSDVRVRRALRFALNRPRVLANAFHGVGVVQESMIAASNMAHSDKHKPIAYDLAKANALLDEAGWKPGPDGVRVKDGQRLTLDVAIYTGAPDTDTMFELIRADWKQIGAEINLQHYELSLFFSPAQSGGPMYGGKFDVTYFSWGGDPIGDISEQYGCAFIPPNGQNVTRWCNKRFDRDLAQFKLLYDVKKRQPYLDDAVSLIIDEAPTVIMFIREDVFAYNSDLKGFKPNGLTPFDDFMNVDI